MADLPHLRGISLNLTCLKNNFFTRLPLVTSTVSDLMVLLDHKKSESPDHADQCQQYNPHTFGIVRHLGQGRQTTGVWKAVFESWTPTVGQ
jgi:hypothetical protein